VGWKVRAAPLAYTHTLSRGGAAEYVVRKRRRLLELAGIAAGTSLPRIELSDDERRRGEADLRAAGAPTSGRRVAFALVTSSRARDWPIDRFAALGDALLKRGITPVVLAAGTPAPVIERMRALCESAIIIRAIARCAGFWA
jgi:ADP-heptose:LPS heptosyltransferase